jgi:methionine-rich copper-binding protein CopC
MRRLPVIAFLILVAGCTAAPSVGSSFVLDDGSIVGPEIVSNGTTTLEISNVGEFNHTLVVTDPDGNVLAATDVVAPGTDTNLSVDLPPGAYQVSCRLVGQDGDGNIIDHYEIGMFSQLEVEG